MLKIYKKILFALFLSLLVWEVVLQVTVMHSPGSTNHPVLGRIYKSGTFIYGKEGYAITHINSLGMRNAEITAKPDQEDRILVLGDSFTEAFQVSDESTFCNLVAKLWPAKNGRSVNVINGGKSGASPAHYIYLADFYNRTVQPDYVVVQLNEEDFCLDIFDSQKRLFLQANGGSFTIVENSTAGSSNPLTQKFAAFDWLTQITTLRIGAEKLQELFKEKPSIRIAENNYCKLTTDHESAVDWTVSSLKNSYGKQTIILYLPTIDYSGVTSKSSEIEQLLEKYSAKYNVKYINMRTAFSQHYLKSRQPVHGFFNTIPGLGHLNNAGHNLVAMTLAEFFHQEVK